MLIFIISVLLTSFICLCFFKKNFWENRYLVLLISGGVALIATLAVNFSVRGKLETKSVVIWTNELHKFYVQDTLIMSKDSCGKLSPVVKEYDYYGDHSAVEYSKNKNDSLHTQLPIHVIFYTKKKDKSIYVGYFKSKEKQAYQVLGKDICIEPSKADSIAYMCKKKLIYDVKPNNWFSGFSMPRISTIRVLYIPPSEYAMIPDSLIHKAPF
jgi:hypothetical protein